MPIPEVGGLADIYVSWAIRAATFFAVLVCVYLIGRFLLVPPLVRVIRLRNPLNDTLVHATREYAQLGFAVLAIPFAVTAAGFGNVVAGSAVVIAAMTLALGVAAQDVIGNLVSGVFLVSDPDFHIGDYIEWEDEAGTVAAIGYRVTRVRTPSGVAVTVPNSALSSSVLHSPFSKGRYRMEVMVEVAMADQAAASAALVRAASDDPRTLADPTPRIHLTEFDGDTAILAAHFWVGDPHEADLLDVRTDFGQRAAAELDAAGVVVPSSTD